MKAWGSAIAVGVAVLLAFLLWPRGGAEGDVSPSDSHSPPLEATAVDAPSSVAMDDRIDLPEIPSTSTDVTSPEVNPKVSLAPTNIGRISGVVRDESGQAIAEALVTLYLPQESPVVIHATTQSDFDGQYEFSGIPLQERWADSPPTVVVASTHRHPPQVESAELTREKPFAMVDFALTQDSGTLSGRVVWDDNGEPLGETEVLFIGTSPQHTMGTIGHTQTDEEGRFESGPLPTGRIIMSVKSTDDLFQYVENQTVPSEDLEIRVPRADGVVRGKVIDLITQRPLPNVEVELAGAMTPITQRTDAEGAFEFLQLPRQNLHLSVRGELSDLVYLRLRERAEIETNLHVIRPVTLEGVVVDSMTSEPVPDVDLNLSWVPESVITTDSEGRFVLEGIMPPVPEGRRAGAALQFEIDAEMLSPGWRVLHMQDITIEGPTVSVLIRVRHSTPMEVLALDPEGNPLPGVRLRESTPNMPQPNYQDTWYREKTDENGRAIIERIATSSEMLMVGEHPDWPVMCSEPYSGDIGEITVNALPLMQTQVLVLWEEQPFEGAGVGVSLLRFMGNFGRDRQISGTTDENGETTLDLYPGFASHIHAAATHPDDDTIWLRGGVEIDSMSPSEEVTIHLQPLVEEEETIIGRVIDLQGRPIAGVQVFDQQQFSGRMPKVPLDTTGPDGSFSVTADSRNFNGGLVVSSETHVPMSETNIALRYADGEEPVEITLAPRIRLRGEVLNSDGTPAAGVHVFPMRPEPEAGGNVWSIFRGRQFMHELSVFTIYDDSLLTDEEGRYFLEVGIQNELFHLSAPLPLMVMAIDVDAQDLGVADVILESEVGPPIELPGINLQPAQEVSFQVQRADGAPAAATVRLRVGTGGANSIIGEDTWLASTDGDGRATLGLLPEGNWEYSVYGGIENRAEGEFTVPAEGVVHVTLP